MHPPVGPFDRPEPIHFIILPLTFVNPRIRPDIFPTPVQIICIKIALINRPIREFQPSFTLFFPFLVFPLVGCSIRPYFVPLSMLPIIFPLLIKIIHFLQRQPHLNVCTSQNHWLCLHSITPRTYHHQNGKAFPSHMINR